jgi:hypothetical protein
VAEEDLREGEVTTGGLLPNHPHGQVHRTEGGEPVEGALALGGAAGAVGGQPSWRAAQVRAWSWRPAARVASRMAASRSWTEVKSPVTVAVAPTETG